MGRVSVHGGLVSQKKGECRMLAGNLLQTSIFFWHLFLWKLIEIG